MTRHTTHENATRRTEANRTENETRGTGTMGDVSHTHPETGETFGDSQVFERGTVAMVDGGRAGSRAADDEEKPMKDVDHTPREDAPDANEAYVRGVERKEDDDESADAEADDDPRDDEEPV